MIWAKEETLPRVEIESIQLKRLKDQKVFVIIALFCYAIVIMILAFSDFR